MHIEIEKGRYRIYYGSNEVDPVTKEWQFVIWKKGKEVARYSNSELLDNGERPVDVVLTGMIKYFMV